MKKFLALLLVLVPLCLAAQTVHTFGALDTQNFWTGNNSYLRLIPPHGPVIGEPPLPLLWTVYVVTDGASGSDCTVGGGTDQHWCGWTGVAWVPLGGTGGGGGATPCGAANDVQTTDGNGNFTCDTGIFEEFANTHTLDVWIGNFAQQIQISDPAHTGVACFGHSNGAVVDSSYCESLSPTFSTANSGYKIYHSDSPALGAEVITSLTPDGSGYLPTARVPVGITELDLKNNGTLYGSVASGQTGSFNFTNCTVSGTAPNFSIACNAGGVTSITLPSDIFTNSPCTGPSCVFAKQVQAQDSFFMGASPAFAIPSFIQATPNGTGVCGGGGTIFTCTFPNAIATGDMYIFGVATASQQVVSVVSNQGDAITTDGHNGSGPYQYFFHVASAVGGSTTITVTLSGGDNAAMAGAEFSGTASVDVSAFQGYGSCTTTLPTITTTNANDLIVGIQGNQSTSTTYAAGPGFTLGSQNNVGGSNVAVGLEFTNVFATGTFNGQIFPSPCFGNSSFAISFHAATNSSNVPIFRFASFSALTKQAFTGLANSTPSQTLGDTQIDLHVGTPINTNADTSAYPGNNAASTLAAVPTLAVTGEAFHCWVYVACHTSVSGATVTPSLLWTDESGSANSVDGVTATCTTLGTNSASSNTWPIRAKSASTIYLKTVFSGSPSQDVHAVCEQASSN